MLIGQTTGRQILILALVIDTHILGAWIRIGALIIAGTTPFLACIDTLVIHTLPGDTGVIGFAIICALALGATTARDRNVLAAIVVTEIRSALVTIVAGIRDVGVATGWVAVNLNGTDTGCGRADTDRTVIDGLTVAIVAA